jgi:Na+-translocating ferredoxin:NAD+ oxidoreductase RnfG subunit
MTGVYIILILFALCAILAAAIYILAKANKKAKKENAALHESVLDAVRKAERLQAALGKQKEAEGKAHEERKGLAGTADSDLVHRANSLFGMPDKPGSGRTGNHQP